MAVSFSRATRVNISTPTSSYFYLKLWTEKSLVEKVVVGEYCTFVLRNKDCRRLLKEDKQYSSEVSKAEC